MKVRGMFALDLFLGLHSFCLRPFFLSDFPHSCFLLPPAPLSKIKNNNKGRKSRCAWLAAGASCLWLSLT
ncbi:hypothetical protein XELAEV_18000281mg [Xenopus laevis]|uniref:Secreted protein n=1 Tax=Xenopus laevis TaxID=8355 RepID=A0A974BQS8_XENLA|nr:hypothetical protein XELAEV_18000281mg [Xenopus laevis]